MAMRFGRKLGRFTLTCFRIIGKVSQTDLANHRESDEGRKQGFKNGIHVNEHSELLGGNDPAKNPRSSVPFC